MLPEWIISGAVVGMQGGTETVRDTWDKLRTYNVPVSAFWLQVMHDMLKPVKNVKFFNLFQKLFYKS